MAGCYTKAEIHSEWNEFEQDSEDRGTRRTYYSNPVKRSHLPESLRALYHRNARNHRL